MSGAMLRAGAVLYLTALHALVAAAIFAPEAFADLRSRAGFAGAAEPSDFARRLHAYHLAVDRAAPAGRLVLIGDSHFQRMDAGLLAAPALNFGVGGATLEEMAHRTRDYHSLETARAVIVWGGVNDLLRGQSPETAAEAMTRLLALIPSGRPAIVLAVPPTARGFRDGAINARISTLNGLYRAACRAPCRFVDAGLAGADGALQGAFDAGDGLHLSARGYERIAAALSAALSGNAP